MHLFEKGGAQNTAEALKIAFEYAKKKNIRHLIVASTWGGTAREALSYLQNEDFILTVVTHNTGFKTPGVQEFDGDVRKMVTEAGGRVITGVMPTRGLGRAIKNKTGFSCEDIACASWRMFCEGMKVCIEIATMACDAGAVPPGPAVLVAGTGKGADTVVVADIMPSNETFNMKIRNILAKPENF